MSERRKADWSVLDSIKALVTDAPLIMTMLDNDGRVLAVSETGAQSLGMPAAQAIGQRVHDLFEGGGQLFEALRAAGAWERGVTMPIRSDLRPDGTQFWFQICSWPYRDETGAVAGLIHQVRDVSIEERALQELNLAEALLDAAVESMPSMLGVIDLQTGGITRVNRAYETFVGSTRESLIGTNRSNKFSAEDLEEFAEQMKLAVASGELMVSERELPDGDGRPRMILRRIRAIEDRIGRKYLLFLMDDVTASHEAEKTLQTALADAEAANQAKSAFLALISHEIRTPLNGVLGMAQVMARDSLSAAQQDRLDVIRASGEALLAILNDLLDLSKIEASQLELECIDFDLAQGLRAAAANLSALADASGLSLVIDVDDVEGVYRGDPTRIRQITSNLISNAIKFTEEGEVRLTAERKNGQITLTVSDTGPGISEAALERLFQKFVQADSSTTRRYGGTGLGLSICRQLSELMGGTIVAESRLGRGARFTVTLPLERVEGAVAPRGPVSETEVALPSLRILAAEDNPTNQRVLTAIFDQVDVSLVLVGDGAQAVEAFKAQEWDVVLMDVQMPVMDGPTAVGHIRKIERDAGRSRTPVIALTANAMEHQKVEYLNCGIDQVVAKPLRVGELFGAIESLVAARAERDAPAGETKRVTGSAH